MLYIQCTSFLNVMFACAIPESRATSLSLHVGAFFATKKPAGLAGFCRCGLCCYRR
jgi:hypothetical protein